ncbi:MAG: hypothetical protein AAFQ87_16535 [Bacteroidota bacterium]
MNRLIICLCLWLSFSWGYNLAQPRFELVAVDSLEPSSNTVTCTVHKSGDAHYLYSAGDANQLDVFQLSRDGKMEQLDSYIVSGGKKTIRGLITAQINGNDFLFAGLKGGNAVEVFDIQGDGTLKSVFVLPDTDTTYLGIVITLEVVHMENASYLFVGGLEKTPGLSSFLIRDNGHLDYFECDDDS